MKMCVDKSFSTSYRTINSYAFPIVISKTLLNKIHHGDCLSLFQQIPDESIDMAFADPPFNLKKQYTDYHDDKTPEEYLDWSNQWLRELVRVVKPTGAIFVHNTPKWLTRYATTLNELAVFRNWIAWDAPTNCFFHGLRPAHYGILCYSKQNSGFCLHKLRTPHLRERSTSRLLKQVVSNKYPVHPFGPVLSNVWTDIPRVTSRNYRNRHPCQLPVQLLERLILLATQEREIILDPFMGTDTTAVAALRLGRKFIGFEQSKEYINPCEEEYSYAGLSFKDWEFLGFHPSK
jgi:site-specific DNA-methyltransferase (adenine-specific)